MLSADPVEIRQLKDAFDATADNGNAKGQFITALVTAASSPEKSGG